MNRCPECLGKGEVLCPVCKGTKKDPRNPEHFCGYCGGSGHHKCEMCGGHGHLPEGEKREIAV